MSIEITNLTPFPNMRFSNLDNSGKEFGVFMAKEAWDIVNGGSCRVSQEQEPFVFSDEYAGEMNFTSIRYPSDLVPHKPTTDVLLDATSYAPEGQPTKSWICGVRVQDASGQEVIKVLKVMGPRYWLPRWKRQLNEEERRNWRQHRDLFIAWELSEPEPITSLPIRYEYAYGGMHQKGVRPDGAPDYDIFEQNPVGRGWIHPELTDHTLPVPAPQIEDENDPICEPCKHYQPQGFGPISPAWLPRRKLGGTYDANWLKNVSPKWPKDYDFAFHNSAPDGLRSSRFLQGDVSFHLVNLHPTLGNWKFTLTNTGLSVVEPSGDPEAALKITLMAKDTLFLEVSEDFRHDPRVYVLWRHAFDMLKTDRFMLRGTSANDQKKIRSGTLNANPPNHPASMAVDPALIDGEEEEQAE